MAALQSSSNYSHTNVYAALFPRHAPDALILVPVCEAARVRDIFLIAEKLHRNE